MEEYISSDILCYFREAKRYNPNMAKFRDMSKFVRIVRNHNLEQEKDEITRGLTEDMSFLGWMKKQDAIDAYIKGSHITKDTASEVYEDVIKHHYIDPHYPQLPYQDGYLKVTSEGRHFLEKTGLIRAWADDNKSLTTFIVSFISGVVLGVVSVIVALGR